ncbi:T9SS type A sorting domain-containing protein [uncultured Dokdonia sp.]|uniref:T9SS type A sorting domain-containing protein n=1 Tax=uncultured Dokdonia sp. TaxID=575653 RepID=UPI00262C8602|nr:T9SS type A sorting domain-containing protein [uncultured Dokdonia sp.]
MKLIYLQFKHLALVCILCFSALGVAQSTKNGNYKSKVTDESANFYEIVAQKRAEFAAMDLTIKANNKAMKQFERWAYVWQDKINADGSFPKASNERVSKETYINILMETQFQNRSATNTWTQVGPVDRPVPNGYVGYPGKGRVNVIAEDPTNTNIMYAGSAAGGIWKTTNNGALWTPKSDFLAGLGVTDILVDPSNTNIIYMATGDENAQHISSIGLFKSTDGGDSWNPTGLTFSLDVNEYIKDIAFAPGSSTTIFALTNTEVKRTTDAGATWTDMSVMYPFDPFTENFQTIVFDPNDAMKVVVSDAFGALYFSTDGGATFNMHDTIQGLGSGQQKLKITSSANDPDFFYGILEDQRDGSTITEQATFRKYRYAFDNTAADLISSTPITGFNTQGGYNQCITVSPTNENNIIVAGVNGYKSTDGGATFTIFMDAYEDETSGLFDSFYVHADHHHVSFLADGETVLNGHDGGVHKGPFSTTEIHPATPWADLSNTLVITQPYNIAVTQEANGDNFMMANQDNDGFSKILQIGGTNARNWLSAIAGDGTSAGIDISDSNQRYLGGTNGGLNYANLGFADGHDQSDEILTAKSDGTAAFVSPISVHPTDAPTIYACYGTITKSTDRGINWTPFNTGLIQTKFIDVTENASSIRIFTIGNSGTLQEPVTTAKRTVNDGATWTTITPPSGQIFNSFAAVPNSNTVYATVSGYNAGNKVYRSTDNGSTWTNISTGLPNIIMKKVIVHKTTETLYLGTELGPYFIENTVGATWAKIGSGLPNVRVDDLEINYTDNILYIGTFGRGMWGVSIENSCTGITKTWNGSEWSPSGAPGNTDTAVLNGTYNTMTHGNLDVCTLTVSGTSTLTVPTGTFVSVQGNVVVDTDNSIIVEHEGSFVQVGEDAITTNNGTIIIQKTTPTIAARNFVAMSSPMSSETRDGVYGMSRAVFGIIPSNFVPFAIDLTEFPEFTDAEIFLDDNNDFLLPYTGSTALPTAGIGLLVFPQPDASVSPDTYDLEYMKGTLNSGTVSIPINYNGPATINNYNILGNPYASAIDVTAFITANDAVNEVYYWEHITNPVAELPGPGTSNFSMNDISIRNAMMGTAAVNGGTAPGQYMASGQGFGIKADQAEMASNTPVVFTNSLRVTGNNDDFRTVNSTSNVDKIWLSLRSSSFERSVQAAIGFTPNATADYDKGYDSKRLATSISLFSNLQGAYLAIQGREIFNDQMEIPLGMSTIIDREENYTISIDRLEGESIENTPVFLVDHLLNTETNLTDEDYTLVTSKGIQADRFTLAFRSRELLNTDSFEQNEVLVYPNPSKNIITVQLSNPSEIRDMKVYDMLGREIQVDFQNNEVNISSLNTGIYLLKISTDSGTLTTTFIKK